jgi:hypothetical protein
MRGGSARDERPCDGSDAWCTHLSRETNARTREERERGGDPVNRGRVTVYEPEDRDELVRQHYAEQAARPRRPVLVPMLVLAAMS